MPFPVPTPFHTVCILSRTWKGLIPFPLVIGFYAWRVIQQFLSCLVSPKKLSPPDLAKADLAAPRAAGPAPSLQDKGKESVACHHTHFPLAAPSSRLEGVAASLLNPDGKGATESTHAGHGNWDAHQCPSQPHPSSSVVLPCQVLKQRRW